jgi:uncharacterized phiE125 gp8 family phage protein
MFDVAGDPIHFTSTVTTDSGEPFSLSDIKADLRVSHGDEDGLIQELLHAARVTVEQETGRAILTQTRAIGLDSAPRGAEPILLPVYPVASVTSITQYSTADAGTVVSTAVYRLDAASYPPRIVLRDGQSWPTGLRPQNALVIVAECGYGTTAAAVTDAGLLHAIRLLVSHWYTHREPVVVGSTAQVVPSTYRALLDSLKLPWL